MVSSKFIGFQISVSRHKFRSVECIKLDNDGHGERPFQKSERT
jgi:hypothetical protein